MFPLGVVLVEIDEMAAVQQKRILVRRSRMLQKWPELFDGLAQIVVLEEQSGDEAGSRVAGGLQGDVERALLELQMIGQLFDHGLQHRTQIPDVGEARPLEERLQMGHRGVQHGVLMLQLCKTLHRLLP